MGKPRPFLDADAKSAFPGRYMDTETEAALVREAKDGGRASLERLIRVHQPWIFNIVLRMVEDYHDAEDLTQDILLKVFRRLDGFKGESRFSTWLYRIAVNHVLTMKKTNVELVREKYLKQPQKPNQRGSPADEDSEEDEIPDTGNPPHELSAIAEELMIKCTLGMLLCLKRKQRIVYILGQIMAVNSRAAGEILDMKPDSFRKTLSRARERIYNFMHDRCSLVNPACACRCERVAPHSIEKGYIDPLGLHFTAGKTHLVRDIAVDAKRRLETHVADPCREVFRAHPFQDSPDFSSKVIAILESREVRTLMAMGGDA